MTPLAGLAAIGIALAASKGGHGRFSFNALSSSEDVLDALESMDLPCSERYKLLAEAERRMNTVLVHSAWASPGPRNEVLSQFQKLEQRLLKLRNKFIKECVR
jgi:hypothetical protein